MIFGYIFVILLLVLIVLVPMHLGLVLYYLRHREEKVFEAINSFGTLIYFIIIAWLLAPFFATLTKDPLGECKVIFSAINYLIQNLGVSGAYIAVLIVIWELIRLRSTIDKDSEQIRREFEKSEKYINTRIEDVRKDLEIIKQHLLGRK